MYQTLSFKYLLCTEFDSSRGISIIYKRGRLHLEDSSWSLHLILGRHMTKRQSDWPELFGMARAKELPQKYQTTLSVAILLVEMVGWERDYLP